MKARACIALVTRALVCPCSRRDDTPYFGTARMMANRAICKRARKTISRMAQANSRWNSCCSRLAALIVWGERSAATRPIATRRRTDERIEERRISTSSALWHGLQRIHSPRGSGASTGSLSITGKNQIKLVQIEQRMSWYQRPLCPVLCLIMTGLSFPRGIMSFARCPLRAHCRDAAGRRSLLSSREASLSNAIIVPYSSRFFPLLLPLHCTPRIDSPDISCW